MKNTVVAGKLDLLSSYQFKMKLETETKIHIHENLYIEVNKNVNYKLHALKQVWYSCHLTKAPRWGIQVLVLNNNCEL